MKKLLWPFLLVLFMSGLALAAQPVQVVPGVQYTFANCSSGGSAAQNLLAGSYLLTVTDEDVWICWAATCASGGKRFPVGTVMLIGFGLGSGNVTQLSCNSAGSTGDLDFTRAN